MKKKKKGEIITNEDNRKKTINLLTYKMGSQGIIKGPSQRLCYGNTRETHSRN